MANQAVKALSIGAVAIVGLSACGNENGEASDGAESQTGQFLTGSSGGVYDILGGGMSQLINDQIESLRVNPSNPPNISVIPGQIASGDAALGIMQVDQADRASAGEGEFDEASEGLAHLMPMYVNVMSQVATADSGIEDLADVEGATVGVPSETTQSLVADLYELAGVSEDDVNWVYLTYAEIAAAIGDGDIDVGTFTGYPHNGTLEDVTINNNVNFLESSDDVVEEWNELHPKNLFGDIPGGTYPGHDDDEQFFAVYPSLVASEDMTDENAYEVPRVMLENSESLAQTHPAGADINEETVQMFFDEGLIEREGLHPGAIEYYEEQGYDF